MSRQKTTRTPLFRFFNNKAQIRGVDFAFGMLIFILVFSQILLVLSTLLFPSLLQLESLSKEQELNKVYSNVFYSMGEPSNWGTIPTDLLSDFRLGLAINEKNELDFTKINRLVSDVSDYWKIDYLKAKISYAMIHDFAVEIGSPLEISITSVSVYFGLITVRGNVIYFGENLTGVNIWTFVIDTANDVVVNTTVTKKLSTTNIGFVSQLQTNITAHYSIVIFAEYGLFQTYKLLRMTREEGGLNYYYDDFDFRPFAKSYSDVPSKIEVTSLRSALSDEAEAFVLFPFSNIDVQYYQATLEKYSTEEGDIYYAQIPVPAKGLAVVLIHERVEDTYKAGYIGIPMLLTNEHGGIFGPSGKTLSTSSVSLTHFILVRDILVRCKMWYW